MWCFCCPSSPLKLKAHKKNKPSLFTHPHQIFPHTIFGSMRPSVLCFPTYPPSFPPRTPVGLHGSRYTISCSPAMFTDGRDERDGAGWLLGYWPLSTNGRPRQGRFHAPPPRRQPSEQHSHPPSFHSPSLSSVPHLLLFKKDLHNKGLTCLTMHCCGLAEERIRPMGCYRAKVTFFCGCVL